MATNTQLSTEQETAVKSYTKADVKGKKLLEKIFGKEIFAPKQKSRMELIDSFEAACKAEKLNPKTILPYAVNTKDPEERVSNAQRMLRIIAKALKGEWVPDYENNSQQKWYCWFVWKEGVGFVFGASFTDFDFTYTLSRLAFPDEETANYFGRTFIALHKIVLDAK